MTSLEPARPDIDRSSHSIGFGGKFATRTAPLTGGQTAGKLWVRLRGSASVAPDMSSKGHVHGQPGSPRAGSGEDAPSPDFGLAVQVSIGLLRS